MQAATPFRETRSEVLHGLIRAFPFATVVAQAQDGLVASHLPFERQANVLQSHIARSNGLATMDGASVLLVFHGPQGYISPNWYPTRHETGRDVPTWNYAVVHVHGTLRVVDDAVWLRRLLETVAAHHEATEAQPWKLSDAPKDHVDNLMTAIVGIEIDIERIEGTFKLSQNHPERNREGVIAGLRHRDGDGDLELAEMMDQYEGEA